MDAHEQWLAQVGEEPLEPETRLVDAHHHLWEAGAGRGHNYLDEHYAGDIAASGHKVVATLYVQARSHYRESGPEHLKPVGETEWVDAIARRHDTGEGPRIAAAIVGHADLCLGASVDEVLEAHLSAAPRRFRGIRHMTSWDEHSPRNAAHGPGLMMQADFRRGLSRLPHHGLVYDAWLFHTQLNEAVGLARAHPDVTIVVNHLGGPLGVPPYAQRRDEVFAEWHGRIRELAGCGNVYMKLGGSGMQFSGHGWAGRAAPPGSDEMIAAAGHYYRAAIDAFSPARCMFESNFPPDRESCSYGVLWNAFKKIAAGYTPAERAHLYCDTAARVYRLAAVLNPSPGQGGAATTSR